MTVLQVFITENCWSCEEAVRIIADVAPLFPDVTFSMLDLGTNDHPEEVFAVPTYVLDGKITYLGNPTREQLIEKLKAFQAPVSIED